MITYNINSKYIALLLNNLFYLISVRNLPEGIYMIIVSSSWPIFIPLTYVNIQNIILIYIYILQTSMKHYFSSMTSE